MKNTIFLIFLCFQIQLSAQIQFNNFEINDNLDVQIGPNSADSLWQIGKPNKELFEEANSIPNALVTDTINSYPTNTAASFILEINEYSTYGFPFLQLEWFQKTDLEEGVDGGVIEASYDSGATWSNIFNDTIYRPEIVGSYTWDTLHNGQAGLTGICDWSWMAICWGTSYGIEPNIDLTILVRFTLYSDSIQTDQEGWMLDDISIVGGVIGSTRKNIQAEPIDVFPNPSKGIFYINEPFMQNEEVELKIHNLNGTLIWSSKEELFSMRDLRIDISNFPAGLYYLSFDTQGKRYSQKLVKMEGQ